MCIRDSTGALCEAAAGYAGLTVLPEGYSVIGVEYKINFLRAITTDKACLLYTSRCV